MPACACLCLCTYTLPHKLFFISAAQGPLCVFFTTYMLAHKCTYTHAHTCLFSLCDGQAAASRARTVVGPPFHLYNRYLRSLVLCQARGHRMCFRQTQPSPTSPSVGEAATQWKGPCGHVQGSEGAQAQRGQTGDAQMQTGRECTRGLRPQGASPRKVQGAQRQSGGAAGAMAGVVAAGMVLSQVRQGLECQARRLGCLQ